MKQATYKQQVEAAEAYAEAHAEEALLESEYGEDFRG